MPVATLKPNADSTPLDWTIGGPVIAHFVAVNEGISTPSDTEYLETQTDGDQDQLGLESSPAGTSSVTQVEVKIRAWLDDSDGESDSRIKVELFHSGSTALPGNPKYITSSDLGGQRVYGVVTLTWNSGINLSKTQVDSLEVRTELEDVA